MVHGLVSGVWDLRREEYLDGFRTDDGYGLPGMLQYVAQVMVLAHVL